MYIIPLCILTYERQICQGHSPLKLKYYTHVIVYSISFTKMQSNWTAAVFYMCFCIIEKCSVPHVNSVPLCILTYQRQICESHSPLKLNYCTHLIFRYLPFTEIQSYCTAVFTCVFASLKSAVSHTGWFMACQGTFLESRFLSLGFMQTQSLYHFSKVALCL